MDVPAPSIGDNSVLIETTTSLISAGTERMLNNFANAGYFAKAKQQPEKVKQVIDKALKDGILETYHAVSQRLDQPLPLGYSNVGIVRKVGPAAGNFKPNDRVVSNGAHSEVVSVSKNLVAKIPDNVTDHEASFTVVGAIALQGIRLIKPTLGETICVAGLGLIGLMAVQMLIANGCRVFGFDNNPDRVELARKYGAHAILLEENTDIASAAKTYTDEIGVDGVLITASTSSHELIHQAATMCRQRGRIVLTGVVGLNINRADFYEKELTFQVSSSYGPGRYQRNYESKGMDYPIGFVRWTENRNFQAVLQLMADGKLDVSDLITNRFPFSQCAKAYSALSSSSEIGVLLEYDVKDKWQAKSGNSIVKSDIHPVGKPAVSIGQARIGIIGAGNFTQATLLPALSKINADIKVIASQSGTTAAIGAKRFSIPESSTDIDGIMARPDIDAVMITTRHHLHFHQVCSALKNKKHVFVEKPLCMSLEELDEIVKLKTETAQSQVLMVGYNRRFAPMITEMKKAVDQRSSPAFLILNCNAGSIPKDHWTQDIALGGGRIIGEACHFIDLAVHLTGKKIVSVSATNTNSDIAETDDNFSISLGLEDGSIAQVNYFSVGSNKLHKEEFSAHWEGKSMVLSNYKKLTGYGVSNTQRAFQQNKGHKEQCAAFIKSISQERNVPIPFEEIENVMRATLLAVQSAKQKKTFTL